MRYSALLALALVGSALGCRAPVRHYRCTLSAADAEVDPHQVWDCHRDIALRASREKEFTLREFRRAAEFFEQLTGIAAASVSTDSGPVPGSDLRQSLQRWDAWYAQNGSRLYWDAAAGRVAVRDASSE